MENKIRLENVDIVIKQDGKDIALNNMNITIFPDDIEIIQEDKPPDLIDDTGMIWTAKKLKIGDGVTPYNELPYKWCYVPKGYRSLQQEPVMELDCGDENKKPKKKRKWKKYTYVIGLTIDCMLCFILLLVYANMAINKRDVSLIQFAIFGFLWGVLFGITVAEWRNVIKDEKEK